MTKKVEFERRGNRWRAKRRLHTHAWLVGPAARTRWGARRRLAAITKGETT